MHLVKFLKYNRSKKKYELLNYRNYDGNVFTNRQTAVDYRKNLEEVGIKNLRVARNPNKLFFWSVFQEVVKI